MGRVFITGDTHGQFHRLKNFCNQVDTSTEDIMIILGDVGLNYHLNQLDKHGKKYLSKLPLTFLCLHGNHEERAWKVDTYNPQFIITDTFSGTVWVEDKYPNIWFLNDIAEFKLHDSTVLAISGAYSIDKPWRLANKANWFESEQIDPDVMKVYLNDLDALKIKPEWDYVLSHTCPFDYMSTEAFLPNIDQADVDNRTEHFLEEVRKRIFYNEWYCGHFHINKFGRFENGVYADKIRFLYDDIIELDC